MCWITMRTFFHVLCLLIPGALPTLDLRSQELPAEVPAWQLVTTFIQETGSSQQSVDREEFIPVRLTGEAAGIDPETIKGRWATYIDVYIDSIITLPERYRYVAGDKEKEIPPRTDTIRRSALTVTTYIGGKYDHLTFFCEHDSIWRIESWRQFPTSADRTAIGNRIASLDTADPGYVTRRSQLTSLLLSEKDQLKRFGRLKEDAERLVDQLLRSQVWEEIDLYRVFNDSVGEYDPLDDDLSATEQFIFRLNRSALRRLFSNGISNIVRYRTKNGSMPLFEVGSVGNVSMGFLHNADSVFPLRFTKDGLFLLRPVAPDWWFYKGNIRKSAESEMEIEEDVFVPIGPPAPGSPPRREQTTTPDEKKDEEIAPTESTDKTRLLRPKVKRKKSK